LFAAYCAAHGLDVGQARAELEAQRRRDRAEAERQLRLRIAEIDRRVEAARGGKGVDCGLSG
jgi:hypothetical protein